MKTNGWITFTAQNILRVMRGEKTQTRRPIKPQPKRHYESLFEWHGQAWDTTFGTSPLEKIAKFAPWNPGDILGVKEGYQIMGTVKTFNVWGVYLADGFAFDVTLPDDEWFKWKARKFPYRATPGRFMYKSLCRTRLEVLDVRAERVQDISEADAIAEGISTGPWFLAGEMDLRPTQKETKVPLVVWRFFHLWNSIYAKKGFGFDVNPWVWATTFKVLKGESDVDTAGT